MHALVEVQTLDSEISESVFKLWLIEQIAMYGKELAVEPLPKDAYHRMHPVEEAIWMRGSEEGVYIVTDEQ